MVKHLLRGLVIVPLLMLLALFPPHTRNGSLATVPAMSSPICDVVSDVFAK